MMVRAADFIKQVVSSTLYRPDGAVETTRDPAVWTLAYRGYSGSGRLDVWAYRPQADALRAGAVLAMEAGMDEDPQCAELFAAGRWSEVMERYEELSPQKVICCEFSPRSCNWTTVKLITTDHQNPRILRVRP